MSAWALRRWSLSNVQVFSATSCTPKRFHRPAQGSGVRLIVLGLADHQQCPLPFAQHQELRQGIGQHGPARQAVQDIAQALAAAQAVVGAAGVEQQAVGQGGRQRAQAGGRGIHHEQAQALFMLGLAACSRASGLSTLALVS
jgi:hypothetical protein